LKFLYDVKTASEQNTLLIAPKGIEISVNPTVSLKLTFLLIAPKGIEMQINNGEITADYVLLIAPKGIEIFRHWKMYVI